MIKPGMKRNVEEGRGGGGLNISLHDCPSSYGARGLEKVSGQFNI